jgi:hypothetical protein
MVSLMRVIGKYSRGIWYVDPLARPVTGLRRFSFIGPPEIASPGGLIELIGGKGICPK